MKVTGGIARRALLAVAFATLLFWFVTGLSVQAQEGETATEPPLPGGAVLWVQTSEEGYRLVEYADGAYVQTHAASELAALLAQVLGRTEGCPALYFDDFCYTGDLLLPEDEVRLVGSLTLTDGSVTVTGGTVYLEGLTLTGRGRSPLLSVTGGSATVYRSHLEGAGTVCLLEGGRAQLLLSDSEVIGTGAGAALILRQGAATLRGTVVRGGEYAVVSTAQLSVERGCQLSGSLYEIRTDGVISLGGVTAPFDGTLRVRYDGSFAAGTLTPLFDSAVDGAATLSVYDVGGAPYPLTYFDSTPYTAHRRLLAVYLPLTVRYYTAQGLLTETSCLAGERLTAPTVPQREGYSFDGFFTDAGRTQPFAFAVDRDTDVWLAYRLLPPQYVLSGLSFAYDGAPHALAFRSLTHPLAAEGSFTYSWYREGERLPLATATLPVRDVADSGRYSCTVTFSHQGELVSVTTPAVAVTVTRAEVAMPTLPASYYTGAWQYPSLPDTAVYTVACAGGQAAGSYPITLTLRDPANYAFCGSVAGSLDIPFVILPAENRFLLAPRIADTYEDMPPRPQAEALFGEVLFTYGTSPDGPFSVQAPLGVGEYYLLAAVAGTANYSSLAAPPLAFSVRQDRCLGLSVASPPERTRYTAFERLELRGLTVVATMESGRTLRVAQESLTVFYTSGDCLHFGDEGLRLSYAGVSVPLPLTVVRASYDLSALCFTDREVIFDGTYHTVPYTAEICGEDGIPLRLRRVGGGIHAGLYTVTLTPYTDSTQYEAPSPLTATLTVLPATLTATVRQSSFVYDGTPKLPTVELLLPDGTPAPLSVSGARIAAGQYAATLFLDSADYCLSEAEVPFEIRRAPLDLSACRWSADRFVYDGVEKSVSLSGLPAHVLLLGYTDAVQREAGTYLATAALRYDTANYEGPETLTHSFCIEAAEYDMSGVHFPAREAIYTGELCYPILSGVLPVGADGSSPTYAFSCGATHVREGEVTVTVTFTSASRNYRTPPVCYTTVRILPREIRVVWSALSFSYDGTPHAPTATSAVAAVSVSGAATDAGEYEATAVSLDPDYTVQNAVMRYRVSRGYNRWLSQPEAASIYEGEELSVRAESAFGHATVRCYRDAAATQEVSLPLAAGVYYLVLSVAEDENVYALTSAPLRFEVLPLFPLSLTATLDGGTEGIAAFTALESRLRVTLHYNSGREEVLDPSAVTVRYERGGALLFGDTGCEILAAGLMLRLPLSVVRARYDMAAVRCETVRFVYDGTAHTPVLLGLPAGVTAELPGFTEVGSYRVTPSLLYDSENYEAPTLAPFTVTVEPAVLEQPLLSQVVTYDGEGQLPRLPQGCLTDGGAVRHAGTYPFTVYVADSARYCFPDGQTVLTVTLTVLPRRAILRIDDLTMPRGEPLGTPSYSVAGLLPGDRLEPVFALTGEGRITATVGHPDYLVSVEDGTAVFTDPVAPAPELSTLLLVLLFFILLSLLVLAMIFRRGALPFLRLTPAAPGDRGCTALVPVVTPLGGADGLMSVTAQRADQLISDALARSLLQRGHTPILTQGRRSAAVGTDALCAAFAPGETVDINGMKARGLLPVDAGVVRIVARGVMDRPLTVMANAFDAVAVKMLVLTGGSAQRVPTRRPPRRQQR